MHVWVLNIIRKSCTCAQIKADIFSEQILRACSHGANAKATNITEQWVENPKIDRFTLTKMLTFDLVWAGLEALQDPVHSYDEQSPFYVPQVTSNYLTPCHQCIIGLCIQPIRRNCNTIGHLDGSCEAINIAYKNKLSSQDVKTSQKLTELFNRYINNTCG